jgi:sortase family protein/Big-like domain-containing protein
MRMRWAWVVAVLIIVGVCASPREARARADLGVASVQVSLTPDRLAADGRTRSTVVATVTPPVPGLTVSFGSSGDASLSTAAASTDAGGRATDVLTASTRPGTQTITASTALGSGSATLTQDEVQPVELLAPSVGIDVPVVAVGVTPQGAMDAPQGPAGDPSWREAFWLRSTSIPGRPGTAALSGHLDDRDGRPAAFWTLSRLNPGVLVVARLSSGESIRYRVTDVHVYTNDEAGSPAVSARFYGGPGDGRSRGQSHLNLMTCTGSFRGSRGFDHRFVAFADRVDQ